MKSFPAALVTALLAAGAAVAEPRPLDLDGEGSSSSQSTITREWVWSVGITTATLTATGPVVQVTGLNPQDPLLQCQDCKLASSVRFEPEHEIASATHR